MTATEQPAASGEALAALRPDGNVKPGGTIALIVAAGRGSRARRGADDGPKQYQTIAGKAVLGHTLERFLTHPGIDAVRVVIHADDSTLYEAALGALKGHRKLLEPVIGGATRQQSVLRGLESLEDVHPELVLIHDGVRCFTRAAVIDACLEALASREGVIVGTAVTDTLKRRQNRPDGEARLVDGPDRATLFAAQTPQAFRHAAILAAHRQAAMDGASDLTDDASVAERAGMSVFGIEGGRDNTKITTPEDLENAEMRLADMPMTTPPMTTPPMTSPPMTSPPMINPEPTRETRTGIGYDTHCCVPGDAVILGGVRIAHTHRLSGHSDADVVLHALTDAVLGALGDGDIGAHFPPSDPQWKGASSDRFLADALRRMKIRDGRLIHCDMTIIAEAPKIGPHREAMRASIARLCGVPVSRVSVKATTNERMGFVGREEGIAVLATATLTLPETHDEEDA